MSLASLESDSFGCLYKMTIGLEGNDVIFRWNKYLQQHNTFGGISSAYLRILSHSTNQSIHTHHQPSAPTAQIRVHHQREMCDRFSRRFLKNSLSSKQSKWYKMQKRAKGFPIRRLKCILAMGNKQKIGIFMRSTLKFSLNRNTYRHTHTHIKNWIIEAR